MRSLFARMFGLETEQQLVGRILPILQMMDADGEVKDIERLALHAHLTQMGISESRARELLSRLNPAEDYPLPTDPRKKIEMLIGAAAVMVSDGDIAVNELRLLHVLALRMQVPPEVLTDIVLRSVALGKQLNPQVDVETDFAAALAVLAFETHRTR